MAGRRDGKSGDKEGVRSGGIVRTGAGVSKEKRPKGGGFLKEERAVGFVNADHAAGGSYRKNSGRKTTMVLVTTKDLATVRPRPGAARENVPAGAGLATAGTKRKNIYIDQALLDQAKAALGAKSETEAVAKALAESVQLAEFREALLAGYSELASALWFDDAASDETPTPPAQRR